METYFSPGDAAVLRFLEHGGGFAAAAVARVIEDGPDRSIVYWPAGSRGRNSGPLIREDGSLRPLVRPEMFDFEWTRRDVLCLMYPAVPYSIWLLWDVPQWSFVGWYANLERPFRRTDIGFDLQDHELDVIVRPDLSWYWKDEHHLKAAVEGGVFSEQMALDIRRAGEAAIARLERRDSPFNEPWPDWRPDPDWGPLELPENWAKAG